MGFLTEIYYIYIRNKEKWESIIARPIFILSSIYRYISQFTSSLQYFFSYFSFFLPLYGTEILSFNNSKEGNFYRRKLSLPQKKKDSKFTAIFGVFPTRPMKKEEEAKLFLQINLCLCIIINYFTSTAIRKTFQKSTGIFQSVQDYFFFLSCSILFVPLCSFCFHITTIMWKGKKATMNEHYRMENSFAGCHNNFFFFVFPLPLIYMLNNIIFLNFPIEWKFIEK